MSFDRLAPHYRWMEAILAGEKLQRCRVAWLDEVRDSRRVLIAGEGRGRFLSEALRIMRSATFVCVDASAAMHGYARGAVEGAGESARVQFIQASLTEWEPAEMGFDLIVTHFFLDCFQSGCSPPLSKCFPILRGQMLVGLFPTFRFHSVVSPGDVRASCSRSPMHFSA